MWCCCCCSSCCSFCFSAKKTKLSSSYTNSDNQSVRTIEEKLNSVSTFDKLIQGFGSIFYDTRECVGSQIENTVLIWIEMFSHRQFGILCVLPKLSLARSPSICFSLLRSICSSALHTQFVVVRCKTEEEEGGEKCATYIFITLSQEFWACLNAHADSERERESFKCVDVFDCRC